MRLQKLGKTIHPNAAVREDVSLWGSPGTEVPAWAVPEGWLEGLAPLIPRNEKCRACDEGLHKGQRIPSCWFLQPRSNHDPDFAEGAYCFDCIEDKIEALAPATGRLPTVYAYNIRLSEALLKLLPPVVGIRKDTTFGWGSEPLF